MIQTSACDDRIEALSRRIDHDLAADEERELATHLAGCAGCRAIGRLMEIAASELHEPEPALPLHVAPIVLQRLRDENLTGRRRTAAFSGAAVFALAAILVLSVGTALMLFPLRHTEPVLVTESAAQKDAKATIEEPPRSVAEPLPAAPSPALAEKIALAPPPRPAAADEPRPQRDAPKEESHANADSVERVDEALTATEALTVSTPPTPAASPSPAQPENEQRERPAIEGGLETGARGDVRVSVEGKAKADATDRDDLQRRLDPGALAPAAWLPDAGTKWDRPPAFTSEAERILARIRGGRVVLKIQFSAGGKVTEVKILDGDWDRGRRLAQVLSTMDRALVPAARSGELIAGVGRVTVNELGS